MCTEQFSRGHFTELLIASISSLDAFSTQRLAAIYFQKRLMPLSKIERRRFHYGWSRQADRVCVMADDQYETH